MITIQLTMNNIIHVHIICTLNSAYDKDQNLSGHSLFSTNSIKFPLIMYSKYVWPNLIWLILAGRCPVTGHYHKP